MPSSNGHLKFKHLSNRSAAVTGIFRDNINTVVGDVLSSPGHQQWWYWPFGEEEGFPPPMLRNDINENMIYISSEKFSATRVKYLGNSTYTPQTGGPCCNPVERRALASPVAWPMKACITSTDNAIYRPEYESHIWSKIMKTERTR